MTHDTGCAIRCRRRGRCNGPSTCASGSPRCSTSSRSPSLSAPASRAFPDFAQNASSLLWDGALGSPTLDGLRGLDSEQIIFWRWLFNSVFVTSCVVVGRVLLAALAGYSLARIRFPGYRLVFALILAVMMVPPIILAIPRFLVLRELGMINTYQG